MTEIILSHENLQRLAEEYMTRPHHDTQFLAGLLKTAAAKIEELQKAIEKEANSVSFDKYLLHVGDNGHHDQSTAITLMAFSDRLQRAKCLFSGTVEELARRLDDLSTTFCAGDGGNGPGGGKGGDIIIKGGLPTEPDLRTFNDKHD